jgi:hypothetical protein
MRCMACGAEMRVVQVVPDETLKVPGYEHHTLQCSGCNDVEQRLVFNRESAARVAAEPAAESAAAPVLPATAETNERIAVPSAWKRAVAMFRGRHAGQR